ncbi:hypothetical protein [Kutzneria sp. NPDC051319]|uniref:hypothetical protein n=1 Tax=Kutzneria sp. NPDC051319 TaxID=3155047 RepID=UPI0034417C52
MPQQHKNPTTTDDIANSTNTGATPATAGTPRERTDPMDSDRTDADRVETDRVDSDRTETSRGGSDRMATGRADTDKNKATRTDSDRISGDRLADDENRVTTIDETAKPADTRLAGRRESGATLTDQREPNQDKAKHETPVPGQRRTDQGTTDQGETGPAAADVLFDEADAARFRGRWHEVQAGFVDDPKRSVQDADVLVAELMQSLASAFSQRKHLLEEKWREGSSAETEDLRLALRGYRSFLDQLLAH